MIRQLSFITLSILHGVHATDLTIADAFKEPSNKEIEKALVTRGGSYTSEVAAEIKHIMSEILQGTYTLDALSTDENHPLQDFLGKLITIPIKSPAQKTLPSLATSIAMKALSNAWTHVHTTLSQEKSRIAAEEQVLSSSVLVRTAQHFARETILQLLYIIHSPQSNFCQRMHALYLYNTVHLLGNLGEGLRRTRARTNRFYFTRNGLLRSCNLTDNSILKSKRMKAIARCIKALSNQRSDYLLYVKQALDSGIKDLQPIYREAIGSSWYAKANRFIWYYAAGLFKETTTIDVMYLRTVDPERIFSHQQNKDFLRLMLLCSQSEKSAESEKLLLTYKNRTPHEKTTRAMIQFAAQAKIVYHS